MESIRNLFIVGPGPSSSHTIGPFNACKDFISDLENVDSIEVILFGSLALTGKGHLTDQVISSVLKNFKHKIKFDYTFKNLEHPNKMTLIAYKNKKVFKEKTYYSVGGGKIVENLKIEKENCVYKFKNFEEIRKHCESKKISLVDLVDKVEDKEINEYLGSIVRKMFSVIEKNLKVDGVLPGKLKIKRVAKTIFENSSTLSSNEEKYSMLVTSFAYASAEGNANGDEIVTAPTCGSCGILPAILYYEYKYNNKKIKEIIDSLKVAGIFGNVCKRNASISGAVLGCQAEIGVASSMASAALSYLRGLSLYQIEYAAEVSLEHFLGLTCDPVDGYVQIPCIERNGIGALRSYTSFLYAKNIAPYRKNRVSFDDVVLAMRETGESINQDYKETSKGGLAKVIK